MNEFNITGDLASWWNEAAYKALEQFQGDPEGAESSANAGMFVRLTGEGDTSIPADFGEAFPYKAERVVYNKTTREWQTTGEPLTFDPDQPKSLSNLQLYVYETNGTVGLTGGTYWVQTHAFKYTTGDMYWAFSVRGDIECVRLTAESAGLYSGDQLDENLAATGRKYDGTDYPQLTPLNSRLKIPLPIVVQAIKRRDKVYFEWKDPVHELGPDSPPSENNGTYNPFAELGGTTGATLANYDPADGIYKYIRLHAVGQDIPSSGNGQPTGIKIEPIDTFNYKLVLVDDGGNEIPPGSPLPPNPNNRTYCTEATFNVQSRILTLTTKDDLDAVICEKKVKIPCCDMDAGVDLNKQGGGGGGGDDDPEYDYPTDSPNDPTDPDVIYTDGCGPPGAFCDETAPIMYPVPAETMVSRLSIQQRDTLPFQLVLVEVLDPNSNDITAFFDLDAERLRYFEGDDLPPGLYQYSVRVENPSPSFCAWSNFLVVCYFEVIEVECRNDLTSTHDGATDPCPVPCDQIWFEADPKGLTVLNKDRSGDNPKLVRLTVQMDLRYQSYPKSGKFRPQLRDNGKGQNEKYGPTNSYRKHVTFSQSFTVEANKSWSQNISVPISTPNRNKPLNRVANGRLELRYKAWEGRPEADNHEFLCSYRDFESFTATIARPNKDGLYKKDDAATAHGFIRTSVSLFEQDDNPDKEGTFVGCVRIDDPCDQPDWQIEIVGGADAALFTVQTDGLKGTIHTKADAVTNKASYQLELKASSALNNCIKELTLNIPKRGVLEDVLIDNGVGPGKAGAPVGTLCAVDGGGQRVPDGGEQNTVWEVVSIYDVSESTLVSEGKEYFQIEPTANGDAILRSRVDVPPGDYTITVQVQNDQMREDGGLVTEKEFTITIDKATIYQPIILKGLQ